MTESRLGHLLESHAEERAYRVDIAVFSSLFSFFEKHTLLPTSFRLLVHEDEIRPRLRPETNREAPRSHLRSPPIVAGQQDSSAKRTKTSHTEHRTHRAPMKPKSLATRDGDARPHDRILRRCQVLHVRPRAKSPEYSHTDPRPESHICLSGSTQSLEKSWLRRR